MADIGTVIVNLSPTIDTGALAASVRSAVADALEQVAGELRAEVPAAATPRLAPGSSLTIDDLETLPVGAVVRDGDGDIAYRVEDNGSGHSRDYPGVARFVRDEGRLADLASELVASYGVVTLVSLP